MLYLMLLLTISLVLNAFFLWSFIRRRLRPQKQSQGLVPLPPNRNPTAVAPTQDKRTAREVQELQRRKSLLDAEIAELRKEHNAATMHMAAIARLYDELIFVQDHCPLDLKDAVAKRLTKPS